MTQKAGKYTLFKLNDLQHLCTDALSEMGVVWNPRNDDIVFGSDVLVLAIHWVLE